MKCSKPIFIALAASLIAHGQVSNDMDFSVVDKLRLREREALEGILEAKKETRSQPEREAIAVQLADIMGSPVYLGHILRGSVLVNIKTDQQELLTKDITVKAYTLPDNSGYIYLQSKSGTPTHKTLGTHVANITEVTRLREPPETYQPVVKRKSLKLRDSNLGFFTELNFHLGLTSPKLTRDLVNDDTKNPGKAVRYEAQVYSNFSMPIFLGASLMAESIKGDLGSDGENYSLSAFSVGPLLKSPKFELFGQPWIATIGARTSLFSKVEEVRANESASYRLAQTSLFIGLQRDIQLTYGAFVLGANFQRQWAKASSDGFNPSLSLDSRYDDSFSISFGHKMGWL